MFSDMDIIIGDFYRSVDEFLESQEWPQTSTSPKHKPTKHN